MSRTTIAIASGSAITLWCTSAGVDKAGYERFSVINGGWSGRIRRTELLVDRPNGRLDSDAYFGEKVWEGEIPTNFSSNYNLALSWLAEHVAYPRRP